MVSTSRDFVPRHIGGECELDPEVRGHQYDLWIPFHSPSLTFRGMDDGYTPPLWHSAVWRMAIGEVVLLVELSLLL